MDKETPNVMLYRKLEKEQEDFKEWLVCQPSEEILKNASEYVVRNDILLALEYGDLPDEQAKAMLRTPHLLKNIAEKWESTNQSYMEEIWNAIEQCAKKEEKKEKRKQYEKGR